MLNKNEDINEEKKIMREGLRILAKIIAEKMFDDLLKERRKRCPDIDEKAVDVACNLAS